ncbi:MAG TPA: TonB-dependent receptor [Balneolaceae bacterium]|nr:TonB-dependent receptor [Balneolaceae bacterium]
MRLRLSLLFLLCFLYSTHAIAQGQNQKATEIVIGDSTQKVSTATIAGNVTASPENTPLPGVNIYVEKVRKGAVTSKNGHYTISLAPGEYDIRFQYLGYKTIYKKVRLYSDGNLDISMKKQALDMDEVIVRGTTYKSNVLNVVPGIESMSITDIKKIPAVLGEANVVNSLLTLPGVTNVGEGSSGFNVRGGRADQNLVLLNGTELFNSAHVLGLYSSFNPDVTQRFTLYKGHIPARYGGRLSSVLDVTMRDGNMDKYSLSGGVGIVAGRLLLEGPIIKDKTSFLLSGRSSYSDWILNLAKNQKVNDSSARFYDMNASITHRLNSNNKITIYGYGSKDRMRYASDFGYAWSNHILNADWSSSLSDKTNSKLTLSYGNYSSNYFDPSGFDGFNLYEGVKYWNAKENIFFEASENHLLNAGLQWVRYDGKSERMRPYSSGSVVESENIPKDNGQEFSAYASDDIQINKRLLLSLGVRYTYYQQLGPATVYSYRDGEPRTVTSITDTTLHQSGDVIKSYGGIEPRISMRYSLSDNSSIKLSYNRTRQYIHQISNSSSPTPADIWQVSNTFLPPEQGDQYSAGLFKNWNNDSWETSIELFYKDIDHLVEYKNFAELFLNNHLETELLDADGKSYGLEFSLKKTTGKWRGWLSYSYTRTFARAKNGTSQETLNNGKWFPSNYDRPNDITLIAERQLGQKSSFSFNFTYSTGRPITAIESSYEDGSTSIPIFSDRNKYRIPDYIRLDISFTIAENIWKNRTVNPNRPLTDSLTISFYNVLARKNAFSVFYKRSGNRTFPRAHKLSVLGTVIPSVTYNFKF